jgi:hypothetical protein
MLAVTGKNLPAAVTWGATGFYGGKISTSTFVTLFSIGWLLKYF